MALVRPLPPVAADHPNRVLRFYYSVLLDRWNLGERALGRALNLAETGIGGPERRRAFGIARAEWSLADGRVPTGDMLTMRARKGLHALVNATALPLRTSVLKNKVLFARASTDAGLPTPETFTGDGLDDWLAGRQAVMIKANFSSKGKGICRLDRTDGGWREPLADERPCSPGEIAQALAKGAILQQALDPHPALVGISPNALPTMRVVTMANECDGYEVVARILRVGGGVNPVDNFNRGGLAALADERGGLGDFHRHADGLPPRPVDRHPATGAAFATALPAELAAQIDELAREAHRLLVPDHAVIGWDIGLGEEGAVLIEGNWNPGTNITQLLSGVSVCSGRSGELYLHALRHVPDALWDSAGPVQSLG